jgi:polycomb protein EED
MDIETGEPLLCVTGKDTRIKVLNIVTGKLVKTLHGHGHIVNDIVTSPIDSSVIASGSEDNSIRVWHTHPKFAHQPVGAILAGIGGHENGLLKMAFHSDGRYLLSGGYDTAVCVWVLPEYPESPDAPYGFAGTDTTATTHFPHFCSTAVHFHYVDA